MDHSELLIWATAYYHYLGWSVEEIGRKIGRDKSRVSSYLKEARKRGYVSTQFKEEDAPWTQLQIAFHLSEFGFPLAGEPTLATVCQDLELENGVSKEPLEEELKELIPKADNLQRVLVCPSGCDEDEVRSETSRRWPQRIDTFAKAVAPRLGSLLDDSTFVGIAWGSTLAAIAEELFRVGSGPGKKDLRFVATVGDDFGTDEGDGVLASADQREEEQRRAGNIWEAAERAEKISATTIARRLKEAVAKKTGVAYGLRGIPATLPHTFDNPEKARNALHGFPNYKRIFGKEGLRDRLDTVLTSVGNVDQENKFYRAVLLNSNRSEEDVVRLGTAYGDIGGALFPIALGDHDADKLASDVMERWTGMRLQDYERIAAKCGSLHSEKSRRPPGVVVVALGYNKREVVRQCLEQNLINTLILDESLAIGLFETK